MFWKLESRRKKSNRLEDPRKENLKPTVEKSENLPDGHVRMLKEALGLRPIKEGAFKVDEEEVGSLSLFYPAFTGAHPFPSREKTGDLEPGKGQKVALRMAECQAELRTYILATKSGTK